MPELLYWLHFLLKGSKQNWAGGNTFRFVKLVSYDVCVKQGGLNFASLIITVKLISLPSSRHIVCIQIKSKRMDFANATHEFFPLQLIKSKAS